MSLKRLDVLNLNGRLISMSKVFPCFLILLLFSPILLGIQRPYVALSITYNRGMNPSEYGSQEYWIIPGGNIFRNNYYPFSSNDSLNTSIISWGVPSLDNSPVVTGDFDHDGFPEVATMASYHGISICDYRGLEYSFSFPEIDLRGILSVDIDGDGYRELVGIGFDAVYVFSVNGIVLKEFDAKLYFKTTIILDINEDGAEEILGANSTGVYLVSLNGVEKLFDIDGYVRAGVGSNINGDGYIDYVITAFEKVYAVDLANQTFLWTLDITIDPLNYPAAGDLDGDGKDEIVIGSTNSICILDDNGDIIDTVSGSEIKDGFSLVDIDNDSKEELFYTDAQGLHMIHVGESNNLLIRGFQSAPVITDIDGDNELEVVGFNDSKFSIFDINRELEYVYPMEFYSVGQYVAISDTEKDGMLDVIAELVYWGEVLKVEFRSISLDMKPVIYETPPPSAINYNIDEYHTYEDLISIFEELRDNYPRMVEMRVIGKSWENRSIWLIKISNGDGNNKTPIMLIGAHHAREYITAETALYIANKLVGGYGSDPIITETLDNLDIYIIPCTNPDGIDYALSINEWQRKNLRPVDDDGDGLINEDPPEDVNGDGYIEVYYYYDPQTQRFWIEMEGYDNDNDGFSGEDPLGGVDLNRNYAVEWTSVGEYGDPSSQVYSGSAPLSEPESRAIDMAMNMTRPVLAISLHSGTETIFFPWGVHYRAIPEWSLIEEVAALGGFSSNLSVMQSCAIYESYGVWDDHAYGLYNILAMTPEIFYNASWPKDHDWVFDDEKEAYKYTQWGIKWYFNPFPSEIEETGLRTLSMFCSMAKWVIHELLSDETPPVITGNDVYINLKYAETEIRVRARDPESGIYRVIAEIRTPNEILYRELHHSVENDDWVCSIPSEINITSIKIVAINRAGKNSSVEITSIEDNYPPELLELFITPSEPTSADFVTVHARIVDRSGINQVILSYSNGTSNWYNVSMRYDESKQMYIAKVPPFEAGTIVQYKIYAEDTRGNWFVSEIYSYKVEISDTIGPTISLIWIHPDSPSNFDDILVYAEINDTSGVKEAWLNYTSGGEWTKVKMFWVEEEGAYVAMIPPQPMFTTLKIVVYAEDNRGNISHSDIITVYVHPYYPLIIIPIIIVVVIAFYWYYTKKRKEA